MNFATMRRALVGPPAPCAPNHGARLAAIVLLVPTALVAPEVSRACATCGCTLSADAATGYSALPGLRLNFEYDYVDQDQLRLARQRAVQVELGQHPVAIGHPA